MAARLQKRSVSKLPAARTIAVETRTDQHGALWEHDALEPRAVKLPGLRRPVLVFDPVEEIKTADRKSVKRVRRGPVLTFKLVKASALVVAATLSQHGFVAIPPHATEFNLIWAGRHINPIELRTLSQFQKINHFPRSSELTRKDRLYVNIQRLQQLRGRQAYDFLPRTFLLPAEWDEYMAWWSRHRVPMIAKPIASSQGRGIFIASQPEEVPKTQQLVLSQYINNPLLVEGFKFDLRIYVAVTSYNPLRIYLYEDGLARFATTRYDSSARSFRNTFTHLTNYSINKSSSSYVACDDDDVEDYGNKWSLSALLQYLNQQGVDTALLMSRIEDVVVKSIVAVEQPIAAACRSYVPHAHNCFELYGFDVLVDDNLKPWLLEVNLSPSLACDAPLDHKIKTHLIADFLTLGMLGVYDPVVARDAALRRMRGIQPVKEATKVS
ncbi:uncharacterized protein MONBRDRAFT_15528 [Monosiga brevicollis MX1]|uniref:Tubulin--tyrosine ligase-like protein 5 n=1 Tax=Monosiga brevicollis TaxID=81824 RepID=A9UUV8_MONBE|nr:uncharacterized protein MONBRDRAFT_15528 [Monosiga brevicollis MX1]EDQ90785.1 predicted protein [Monosiga brevicollis MX1]|eukprot:XP_001744082.1 hypothetical protein [Monosiga brevicollis MX1]